MPGEPADENQAGSIAHRTVQPPQFPVFGTLFDSRRPGTGVALIGGSGGGELREVGEWLAGEGFPSLSLSYFGREGLPRTLRDIPLEYLRDACTALARHPLTEGRPPVLLGASRGSEAALLTAVHFPQAVGGVIAVVPSNVAVCSWPPGGPAWLLNGAPLPYSMRFGPYTLEPQAEIAVEKIRVPVLLISAGADQTWPSSAMSRAIAARIDRGGGGATVQHLDYPDATHALGMLLPSPDIVGAIPSWPADDDARSDARKKVLAFLRAL
ncbi:MAG TPA: acyl-CoA thioester hydrolase/BAAT C-terminal domain-containing protein [Vicinamibacteria bacterium]|jgi:dienelactone hydrolase|nr:acyl-CoA thioester hydrolase/BAAT C-terminal domain-containing protein [Vicinamibacteria bacterium]